MELRNLKTFQVVAEELNITKAAKKLGYTQPTITLQLQALEKELNHRLLTRVGKTTLLTAAGKKLKNHVDRLFIFIEEIEKEMEELRGPSGILTIAASEYYCSQHLPTLINTYMEIYPDVKVNLLPLNSAHAIQSVRNGVADIAIIANACNDYDMNNTFLEEEQALLVVSSKISKEKSLQSILDENTFISYDHHCSFSHIVEQFLKEANFQPKSTIMVGGSDENIKMAVLNGIGYAILGQNAVKNELKNGSITILQEVSNSIVTSAINLKVRSEEPNIQTFNEFLLNAWPVNETLNLKEKSHLVR